MADPNEPVEIDTTDARAGTNTGVRYILIISLVLVVAIFAVIFLWNS